MYHFIVNPNSRSGAGQQVWIRLRRELVKRRVSYQFYLTKYVGHAVKLAAKVSMQGTSDAPVYLIIVGGDGTIHEVLSGITDFDHVILGFIPTGSGNDFCRGMHLPNEPLAALDSILARAHIGTTDVPCITQPDGRISRFGISAGMGYDAAVCQEVSLSTAKKYLNRFGLGRLVYVYVALKQLMFTTPVPMTLYLDGKRKYSFRKCYFTAIMNQAYEGGGFRFCPAARPDDGILDVIVVNGISRLKLLVCLPTAFFGQHVRIRGIHIFRCRHIEINSAVPLTVHHDGEFGGISGELTVSLEKKSIKIILPAQQTGNGR